MKRSFVFGFLVLAFAGALLAQGGGAGGIFAPPATPAGPLVDEVNAMVTAFNNRDAAYFQKAVAADAVWYDEDGHALRASVWVARLLAATPARKLTITNLRVGNWDTAGWAGFNYVMEGTDKVAGGVKGTNTLVYKKNGNAWQIANVHGAVDLKIGAH